MKEASMVAAGFLCLAAGAQYSRAFAMESPAVGVLQALSASPQSARRIYDGNSTDMPAASAITQDQGANEGGQNSLSAARAPVAPDTSHIPVPTSDSECEKCGPFKEWYPGFGERVGRVVGGFVPTAVSAGIALAMPALLHALLPVSLFAVAGILIVSALVTAPIGGAIGRFIGRLLC